MDATVVLDAPGNVGERTSSVGGPGPVVCLRPITPRWLQLGLQSHTLPAASTAVYTATVTSVNRRL